VLLQVTAGTTREGGFSELVAACVMDRVLTAEYKHGYPAILEHALDSTSIERRRKPVAFVGWGDIGGREHRATPRGGGRVRDGTVALHVLLTR
jgi:NAD(P)H-dependent FMN reductase